MARPPRNDAPVTLEIVWRKSRRSNCNLNIELPFKPEFPFCLPGHGPIYPPVPPLAIFLHPFSTQSPGSARLGRLRDPKGMICPISKHSFGHFSPNLLRRPDWFRIPAALTRLAAPEPPCAVACFRTGATSDGPPPAWRVGSRLCRWQPNNAMEGAINLDVDAGNGGMVSEKSLAARSICVRNIGTGRGFGSSGSPGAAQKNSF
jgi:hypothetical protein